jgi:hypothetical protein
MVSGEQTGQADAIAVINNFDLFAPLLRGTSAQCEHAYLGIVRVNDCSYQKA